MNSNAAYRILPISFPFMHYAICIMQYPVPLPTAHCPLPTGRSKQRPYGPLPTAYCLLPTRSVGVGRRDKQTGQHESTGRQ